jgi:LAO/AO transport system kinase
VRTPQSDNIYFRSLSSRGHVGGLTSSLHDIVAVLSLFDFSRVVVETVGAGQSDTEIASIADCTIVVGVPGLGDGIQASKAGILEIGDIFVMNKSDLPGAEEAAQHLERMLSLIYPHGAVGAIQHDPNLGVRGIDPRVFQGTQAIWERHGNPAADHSSWSPPVIRASAADNHTIERLAQQVDQFLAWSRESRYRRRRIERAAHDQLLQALARRLLEPYLDGRRARATKTLVTLIAERKLSPDEAAEELLQASNIDQSVERTPDLG